MKDRSKVLFGLVMLLMLVGIISFSYALFTTKVEKKGALNIVTGDVFCPMEIEGEGSNQITLGSNEEKEVEVTIRNDSLVPIHSILTYSANENVDVLASSSNGEPVNKQSLPVGETRTYTIKLINWGTNTENVTINGRCGLSNKDLVIATEEKEITIKPNDPQLVEGLIPVIYDEEKSSWVKADTTKTWYNYNKQEWANAVTVVETTTAENGHNRDDYMNADPGTPILMDDINTMWVWIPRYEYNYQNMIKEQEIDIKFVSSTVTKSNDSENYKVHPAFTFGEEQLEGFWYGKFETSNDEEKFKEGESDNSSLTPIIKPGVISWRYVQIVNMFYAAFNMKSAANELKYGFSSNGSIDTHMSKNSEWGAVAYLSQSKYGKYGNDMYEENDKEVYINNCDQFITGVAGDTASAGWSRATCTKNTYETEAGQKASTTGNITGIYDMSGSAQEYVMGVYTDDEGNPRSGYDAQSNSGFNGQLSDDTKYTSGTNFPEEKYYDLYTTTSSVTACEKSVCYGHALSETAGWYGDYFSFVRSSAPWGFRGDLYDRGSGTGIFHFYGGSGEAGRGLSFRLVLAPIEK